MCLSIQMEYDIKPEQLYAIVMKKKKKKTTINCNMCLMLKKMDRKNNLNGKFSS